MHIESPISALRISPNYVGGFLYCWEMAGGFNDPAPWVFRVQMGQSPRGPWKAISPDLVNVIAWHDEGGKHLVGKSDTLYFRLALKTSAGMYFSGPVQPYGDLPRREFLLAREIMRREALRARVLSGVECDVYISSTFGPRCPRCTDPITGDVRDTHCRMCYGTGRYPAYFGPHRMMLSFSPDISHHKESANDGTHETRTFEALAIGSPVLKKGDVVIDIRQDKRYVIGSASMVAEIRRVACLQRLGFDESPLSDVIYRIGNPEEEECDGD